MQKTTSDRSQLPTMGEGRAALLARVHAALGRDKTQAPSEPAPVVDESIARLASSDADLPALFTERAQSVGMKVHRVSLEQVVPRLRELLGQLEARRIGVAAGSVGERLELELDAALQADGVKQIDWQAREGVSAQYDLDVGITDVHAAIAETGTLVCCSGSRSSRGLSLVPPVHIALVRVSDILPDMIDYWARLKGMPNTELPSSQAFITGPSKTADIEGELVTGVHGPGAVHILLIDG
ncbi:lactate utilization protein C [Phycisphaerales bacterium AB-hyl4]|uniref:Lactate utilization protein C n=1 Tax=Natronomicrosphaera hydrolytica TaxID=3242702 RepID=A0ABV4U3R3_9BACT